MQINDMMIATGSVQDDDQRAGQMKQKDQTDNADRNGQLDDFIFERGDGTMNQVGAVIGRDNFHAFGKAGLVMSLLIFALTRSMTLRTFSPKRTITIPPATSPLPSRSASPRRISGPS